MKLVILINIYRSQPDQADPEASHGVYEATLLIPGSIRDLFAPVRYLQTKGACECTFAFRITIVESTRSPVSLNSALPKCLTVFEEPTQILRP